MPRRSKKRKVLVLETPYTRQSNYMAGGCKLQAVCPICKKLAIIHIHKKKPIMMEECKHYYEVKDIGNNKSWWAIRFRKIKPGPKPVVEESPKVESTLFSMEKSK